MCFNWLYTHHWGGLIMMLIFWVLVIFGAIWLYKNFNNNNKTQDYKIDNKEEKNPEEIARKRYARGEIDKEKLEEILQTLKKSD